MRYFIGGDRPGAGDQLFSRVQDMAIWYNQSLKTDKQSSIKLNYRNVQYGGIIAYNSISAMVDMPLLSKAKKEAGNSWRLFQCQRRSCVG